MAYLIADKKEIDIIVVSEPNRKMMENSRWIVDKKVDVGVYFRNRNVPIISVEKRDGFIRVQCRTYSIYCCYCSPNVSFTVFEQYVETLMHLIRAKGEEAIVMGDLNIKSPRWGSPVSDMRGEYFVEWIDTLDLVVHNTGDKPTFVRGRSESYIDVTCSTHRIARDISNWTVLDEEPVSDHSIIFEIGRGTQKRRGVERQMPFFDNKHFRKEVEIKIKPLENKTRIAVAHGMDLLTQAYRKSCVSRGKHKKWRLPYWWNEEIETKRKECIKLRRKLTRWKGKIPHNIPVLEEWERSYKLCRKVLRRLIEKSKLNNWKALCNELNENLWGNGYKIAMKHLKSPPLPYALSMERKEEIMSTLFPDREDTWERGRVTTDVEVFTVEELMLAGERMKSGKAPGPDNITSEVVKEVIKISPKFILAILNEVVKRQEFPERWKVARVCLIPKGGKTPDNAAGFRPICLLDTMGKLLEFMIRERLELEISKNGGLSQNQFGFRRGLSTVQAVESVIKLATKSQHIWCILVTFDVRNAFNTVTWSLIVSELKRRGISKYLINIIESYFKDRWITISGLKRQMKVGVPQGSVLGPTLRNLIYDGILREDLGEGVTAIAYADDLAIVAQEEDIEFLNLKTNEAIRRVDRWLKHHDLELAPEKTEAVVLKGKRNLVGLDLSIRGTKITFGNTVKYLGIVMGRHLRFGEHIRYASKKLK